MAPPTLRSLVASAFVVSAAAGQCQPEWLPTPPGAALGSLPYAFESSNGDLIAGGDFTSAGGLPAAHIARWDGAAWAPLGAGLDGVVFALAGDGADLIAGGSFASAGGLPAANVAR